MGKLGLENMTFKILSLSEKLVRLIRLCHTKLPSVHVNRNITIFLLFRNNFKLSDHILKGCSPCFLVSIF